MSDYKFNSAVAEADLKLLEKLIANAKGNKSKSLIKKVKKTKEIKLNVSTGEEALSDYLTDEVKTETLGFIERQQTSIKNPPVYFKPAFLLDNPTPFLKVLIQTYNDKNEIEYINLFNDEIDPTYNNLVNFKYDLKKGGEATIQIVDVDQDIIELLVLRFAYLRKMFRGSSNGSTINLLVEFGWQKEKGLKKDYGDKVHFTKAINLIFDKFDVNYGENGKTEATITGKVNEALPPPFHTFLPNYAIGSQPGVTIALSHLLLFIDNSWGSIFSQLNSNFIPSLSKSKNIKLYNLFMGTTKFFYHYYNVKNLITLNKVMVSILKYYVNYNDAERDVKKLLTHKNLKSGIKLRSDRSRHVIINKGKIKFEADGLNALNTDFVVSGSAKEQLSTIQDAGSFNQILDFLFNETSDSSEDIEEDIKEKKYKENSLSWLLGQGKFNDKLIETLKQQNTLDVAYSQLRLKKMVNMLTPIAKDNVYIHPWLVFKYILEAFKEASEKFNYSKSESTQQIKLNFISMVDYKYIEPIGCLKYEKTKNKNLSFLDFKYNDIIQSSKILQEQWCYRAGVYNIGFNETWQQALSSVQNKMKYHYTSSDKKQVKKISGVKNKNINKSKKIYSAPVSLKVNSFVASPKQAIKNIESMVQIFKQKLKYQSDIQQLGELNISETVESIKILKSIHDDLTSNEKDNQKMIMLVISDIMSSDGIFNPDIAQQHILQTYSVRAGSAGESHNAFNPGFPTVWDINFPDVLSFNMEYDFLTAMTTVINNADATINKQSNPKGNFGDLISEKRKELLLAVDGLESMSKRTKKRKRGKDKIKQIDKLFNEYKKIIEQAGSAAKSSYVSKNKIGFNLNFNEGHLYSGSTREALNAKKQMQEVRKRLVMQGLSMTGTMSVLGDASFDLYDLNKWIFVKFHNQKGKLGMFTGIYQVTGITQEIAASIFKTTFELLYTPGASDPKLAKELEELWTKYDKISIN